MALRQSLAEKNATATQVDHYTGLNYNKGHWLDLVLVKVKEQEA